MEKNKKEVDEKIRQYLIAMMELEEERLNEQMEECEPHVFSEEFERKMQNLLTVHRKRCKRRAVLRFAAKMAACLLLCVGLVTATHTAVASLPAMDIKGWFAKHFEFSKGSHSEEEIAFSEEMITYIPEGFVKTEEEKMFTYQKYVYKNPDGKYFCIRCSKTVVESQQDNENIVREVINGENGIEYTRIKQKDEVMYIWEDEAGIYYYVFGNIKEEELKLVMISLQGGE